MIWLVTLILLYIFNFITSDVLESSTSILARHSINNPVNSFLSLCSEFPDLFLYFLNSFPWRTQITASLENFSVLFLCKWLLQSNCLFQNVLFFICKTTPTISLIISFLILTFFLEILNVLLCLTLFEVRSLSLQNALKTSMHWS